MRGRKKTPDGRRENVCVKVSEAELAAIDAACGTRSRSGWGRDAFLLALGREPEPEAAAVATAATVAKPAGHSGKHGRARTPQCDHRLPEGAWCKDCQAVRT